MVLFDHMIRLNLPDGDDADSEVVAFAPSQSRDCVRPPPVHTLL